MKAHLLAAKGAGDWTVVVADLQTQGRGREGRRWESRKGGLWFSVILRPKIPAGRVSLLQFLASNATRNAVLELTGVRASVKWPNDLVLKSGKLAGILVESKTIGDKVSHVIVGIGLNVNQNAAHLPTGATSILLRSGRRHALARLLASILTNMKSQYEDLENPTKILEEWWANCIHRPVHVQVETSEGTVRGISTGIDREGALLVETERHVVERVEAGTLRILDSKGT